MYTQTIMTYEEKSFPDIYIFNKYREYWRWLGIDLEREKKNMIKKKMDMISVHSRAGCSHLALEIPLT